MKELEEGIYIVKLLSLKRHNANTYKLNIEIMKEWAGYKPYEEEPKVLEGYARRYSKDFSDIAVCFSNNELHTRGSMYVGQEGLVSITSSGWLTLMARSFDQNYFSELPTPKA